MWSLTHFLSLLVFLFILSFLFSTLPHFVFSSFLQLIFSLTDPYFFCPFLSLWPLCLLFLSFFFLFFLIFLPHTDSWCVALSHSLSQGKSARMESPFRVGRHFLDVFLSCSLTRSSLTCCLLSLSSLPSLSCFFCLLLGLFTGQHGFFWNVE